MTSPSLPMPSPISSRRAVFAIIALAMGGFGIGVTEFVPMGLLPNISADLLPTLYAVSSAQANAQTGHVVSAYALGVVVGAPTIAVLFARLPRKKLLLWLLAAFVTGTILASLAPNFGLLLVARFLSGLPHGAYFGIASLVAATILGPNMRGRGVSLVLAGLTIANVVGVPSITWVGQTWGWRAALVVVACVFATALISVALAVPWQPGDPSATPGSELSAFKEPQVWLAALIGAIGLGGFFAMYAYLAPIVTTIAHLPSGVVPWVLVCVGIGMTVGNLLGGYFTDHNLRRTLYGGLVAMGLALTFTLVLAHVPVFLFIGVLLVGTATSVLGPAIQTRLLDVAHNAQSIAAALTHSALNIGNALGAFLGGLVIAAGLGYLSPIWMGIALTVVGLGLTVAAFGLERRSARRVAQQSGVPQGGTPQGGTPQGGAQVPQQGAPE